MQKTVLCAKSESESWRTTLPVQLTVQPNSFAMGSTHYYPLWLARSTPERNTRSSRSIAPNHLRRRASEGWFDRGPTAHTFDTSCQRQRGGEQLCLADLPSRNNQDIHFPFISYL